MKMKYVDNANDNSNDNDEKDDDNNNSNNDNEMIMMKKTIMIKVSRDPNFLTMKFFE